MIEIYEGVVYRENFQISPLREVIEKMFALGLKFKEEHNDSMQGFVKLVRNSFLEFKLEKTLINFVKVNHNMGWKQNTIKKVLVFVELLSKIKKRRWFR